MKSARRRASKVWIAWAAAGVVGVFGSGCGSGEEPSPPSPAATTSEAAAKPPAAAPAVDAMAEAEQIFATRCTTCHGAQGAGDGPGSAGLAPPPRNFQDPEWQASVTDEHIEKIILYGGAAVGRSPAMPGNPDLVAKKPVVVALREHIRGLAP